MENEKSKVQKRTFTAVEQACHEIYGFREFYEQIEEKMVLSGQTRSTLSNYIRKLSYLSLKFGKLPHKIPEKDINGYLASLARGSKTPSLRIYKGPWARCSVAVALRWVSMLTGAIIAGIFESAITPAVTVIVPNARIPSGKTGLKTENAICFRFPTFM